MMHTRRIWKTTVLGVGPWIVDDENGNPICEVKEEAEARRIADIPHLEDRVKELESDLRLNASMLAKQCDLAREAEIRVKELEEAIDDHRHEVYSNGIPDIPVDIDLYVIRAREEKP